MQKKFTKVGVVLGLLRGDEGKGKIVDKLSDEYDLIIRFQGGPNAGHTIYRGDKKIVLHQIPSGILNNKECLIAHGCVVDPCKLLDEINLITDNGITLKDILNNLKVANGCTAILPTHIKEDIQREDAGKGNGSTKCGISPTYRDKYYREGKRLYDYFSDDSLLKSTCKLFDITTDEFSVIQQLLIDDTFYINYECKDKNILFEGAQGVFLDIDNPLYPNVSSSHVNVGGVIAGSGISYQRFANDAEIVGVVKAYMSSVGVGKFLTEINGEIEIPYKNNKFVFSDKILREAGKEYGATTGRPRKVGFLDLPMIKYACDTIGINQLCLTRIDTLYDAFKALNCFPVCIGYTLKDSNYILPETEISWYDIDKYKPVYKIFNLWEKAELHDKEFCTFINFIEDFVKVPIRYISAGPIKEDLLELSLCL